MKDFELEKPFSKFTIDFEVIFVICFCFIHHSMWSKEWKSVFVCLHWKKSISINTMPFRTRTKYPIRVHWVNAKWSSSIDVIHHALSATLLTNFQPFRFAHLHSKHWLSKPWNTFHKIFVSLSVTFLPLTSANKSKNP